VRCTIVLLSSDTATEPLPDDAPRQIMPTRSVLSESGLLTVYRCVDRLLGRYLSRSRECLWKRLRAFGAGRPLSFLPHTVGALRRAAPPFYRTWRIRSLAVDFGTDAGIW
jgi:hypothetical protein